LKPRNQQQIKTRCCPWGSHAAGGRFDRDQTSSRSSGSARDGKAGDGRERRRNCTYDTMKGTGQFTGAVELRKAMGNIA